MFGLPESTYFGKLVPKNKFYDKLTIDKKLERSFIDQINSIRWAHKLFADTLNVEKGSIVEEVEVFLIKLKTSELDLNVLRQMDRQLHYHLIFILVYLKSRNGHSLWRDEISRHDYEVVNRHLIHLSRQIEDSAKGCPKRNELMYGNTTAAQGERHGAVDKVVFSDIKKQPVVFTRPICKDLAV